MKNKLELKDHFDVDEIDVNYFTEWCISELKLNKSNLCYEFFHRYLWNGSERKRKKGKRKKEIWVKLVRRQRDKETWVKLMRRRRQRDKIKNIID